MKINYLNIQGAIQYGMNQKKLENLRKTANHTLENLEVKTLTTYQNQSNAIIAINKNTVIGFIDFENIEENDYIHNIQILPDYLDQEVLPNLIEMAIYELKKEKPIITIPQDYIPYLKSIIEKYDWNYTSYTIGPKENMKSYGYNEPQKVKILQQKKQINE